MSYHKLLIHKCQLNTHHLQHNLGLLKIVNYLHFIYSIKKIAHLSSATAFKTKTIFNNINISKIQLINHQRIEFLTALVFLLSIKEIHQNHFLINQ